MFGVTCPDGDPSGNERGKQYKAPQPGSRKKNDLLFDRVRLQSFQFSLFTNRAAEQSRLATLH